MTRPRASPWAFLVGLVGPEGKGSLGKRGQSGAQCFGVEGRGAKRSAVDKDGGGEVAEEKGMREARSYRH